MTKLIISQELCKGIIATYLILVKALKVAEFVRYIKEPHLVYTLSYDFE